MFAQSPLLLTIVVVASASVASAASVSLDGLVKNSPFMPPQSEQAAAPVVTEGAAVEFRGMITTKEGQLFGLYDRTKNIGAWVKQADAGADFRVSSYDPSADLVTLDYQGQRYTLPLSSARVGAAAPSPLPVVNNGNPQHGGATRVTAVPGRRGNNDQQRLESVAAEVRRRRALRQAASSNANPAATQQPANAGQ
jgi:hypothetical protein